MSPPAKHSTGRRPPGENSRPPTLTGACVRQWGTAGSIFPDWPPKTGERVLHLHRGGKLGAAPPHGDDVSSTFRYDPADPTPPWRPFTLAVAAGYRVDTKLG